MTCERCGVGRTYFLIALPARPFIRASAAALSQLSGTGAFKASGKGKNAIDSSGGPVKVGSRVRIFVELETKGAAYFKGTCPEFGQFGVVSDQSVSAFSANQGAYFQNASISERLTLLTSMTN